MKALFHRFQRKDKDKEHSKDSSSIHSQKEKLPQLPPLPEWPPQRASTTPSSVASFKPLPEISTRPLPPVDSPLHSTLSADFSNPSQTSTPRPPPLEIPNVQPDISTRSDTPKPDQDSSGRNSRKTASGSTSSNSTTNDVQKKVAFISPPPSSVTEEQRAPWPDAPSSTPTPTLVPPLKTTLSRFQAAHGKEPRGPTATNNPSASKTDLGSNSMKATSTRTVVSPPPQIQSKLNGDAVSVNQSVRSMTPYSQMSGASSSRILAAASWSEGAEEDLVSNLGSRERTRQEVLFEILASEERYVQELIKMRDTFIEPLLHPFATPSTPSTPHPDYDNYSRVDSPLESNDNLPPIAARFMSPTPFRPETPATTPTPRRHDKDYAGSINTDDEDEHDDHLGQGYPRKSGRTSQASKHNHPRSPYRATQTRTNQMSSSTQSLGRQSGFPEQTRERKHSQGQSSMKTTQTQTTNRGVGRKPKKSLTKNDTVFGNVLSLHQIPDDLRICLEVIDNGVLEGHKRLSEALRKRYEEQYPLVRSLADVFVANSDIFHGYAKYVLHLERALEQVDESMSDTAKKPKNKDAAEWAKVCKSLRALEESAAEKGETGLAITLSKPFQRLLKYPLLFQNLLFHTDPSTFEYESTLQMVAEIEAIVRSIEDEKIQKEERDKTRDVFARIEGLEKVKQLALPKPSRVLIEERPYISPSGLSNSSTSPKSPSSPPSAAKGIVKGKSSFKRLSDVLNTGGMGGKKDLWLVVFNDVVLQCQRTGTTSLPLVSVTNPRTNSLPELQGKSKYATTGRRNSHTKPRNLYKFIKFETWSIGDVVQPREGVVSMEDVARTKSRVYTSSAQPRIVPLPDDDEDGGAESDDSDKKSKMSFSYWGADKITVQKPNIKPRIGPNGIPRRPGPGAAYARESSANAKFGSRLVSSDSPTSTPRTTSRRAHTSASRRAPLSDDTHSMKVTVTRPAWDTSTRSQVAATPIPKRTRNISQGSNSTVATRVPTSKGLASPAPSEDSGVGFYRQIMQDPTLSQS